MVAVGSVVPELASLLLVYFKRWTHNKITTICGSGKFLFNLKKFNAKERVMEQKELQMMSIDFAKCLLILF